MEDYTTIRKAMILIGQGLVEKDSSLREHLNRYPYSPKFLHGINLFLAAGYQLGGTGTDLFRYADEASFCARFLCKPISDWFQDWHLTEQERLKLKEEPFFAYEPFAYNTKKNAYAPSEECLEFLHSQDANPIEGTDQRVLYEKIMQLEQKDYSGIRKLLIENPILSQDTLREYKMNYADNPTATETLGFAYETFDQNAFRCPICGWTMTKGENGMQRHPWHFEDTEPVLTEKDRINRSDGPILRLKRGIMRYLAQPGKLELEIAAYCEKKSLQYTLWPQMDRFDVEIQFSDGEIWEIDAKAYRNPRHLRSTIENEGGFPSGDYRWGYYVVPTEYTRNQSNYTKVVSKAFTDQKNVSCVSLSELKKEISRKEAGCLEDE